MDNARDLPLGAIHGALSHLHFAVKQSLPSSCEVKITWQDHTYLCVEVKTYNKKHQDIALLRLQHGILYEDYDYRFKMMAHSVESGESYQEHWIHAYPDLHHIPQRLRNKQNAA